MQSDFLKLRCTPNNLDRFIARRAILDALCAQLAEFSGILLDIGCGNMPYKSLILAPPSRTSVYIGMDIPSAIYRRPDVYWDGQTMPLESDSLDCAMATEVIEHCPDPEVIMRETFRVLRPRAVFFFTVPFLWPLHDVPYDECRYTPFALERHLRNAGFGQVRLNALGGWDASLAQMLGLWARRRAMSPRSRRVISSFLSPVVSWLIHNDRVPSGFPEGLMITGICGTARK